MDSTKPRPPFFVIAIVRFGRFTRAYIPYHNLVLVELPCFGVVLLNHKNRPFSNDALSNRVRVYKNI